ncbi:MAG: sulfite exporter TauE/SafE family protein [Pyrinomonadaceae bacterium MAG19_C2-C3]|nr:sulfite exporter TauE/SafE family protein [Pyrinomonadaceae bacterium MAG19_C2-C3]
MIYHRRQLLTNRRATFALFLATAYLLAIPLHALAHPLGNFTINVFTRIEPRAGDVRVRYVVDMAEIPTFQTLQTINADGDGSRVDTGSLEHYAARAAAEYKQNLRLTVNGASVPLELVSHNITTPPGNGNLPTLRLECEFTGTLPPTSNTVDARRVEYADLNFQDRIGWHETIVVPGSGVAVFDSTIFGNTLSDELRAYPENLLAAPINERTARFSFSSGAIPPDSRPLLTRDGDAAPNASPGRDRLSELIAVKELTPGVALLALLFALVLGAAHALSPGHGKTIVGAYLVGSRGTVKHAAFLGATVTITHTLGVFALGLVTLFAAKFILPERLFPILSFISGAIVILIGAQLFISRLRLALGGDFTHDHAHDFDELPLETSNAATHQSKYQTEALHENLPSNIAASSDASTVPNKSKGFTHAHGGSAHTHVIPGADDATPITWRSLLGLGISGGLLPCPSALVVLLSAIAAGHVGFGLLLVVAFSIGLAATLTAVGLTFLYVGRTMKRSFKSGKFDYFARVLPVASAFVITILGAFICYEALAQAGFTLNFWHVEQEEVSLTQLSSASVMLLGFVFGLKHATEADHVVAVSTIVSQYRNVFRAGLVGGLWGIGHTASLVVVGVIVLALRVAIPESISNLLELGVALMIVILGITALIRALRERGDESDLTSKNIHSHSWRDIGFKPFLVGSIHGLAGSGTLTVLVLTQIESIALGLLYLAIFGAGSIIGMLLMSGLIGLPFAMTSNRVHRFSFGLQSIAATFSILFGLWYAYQINAEHHLFGTLINMFFVTKL